MKRQLLIALLFCLASIAGAQVWSTTLPGNAYAVKVGADGLVRVASATLLQGIHVSSYNSSGTLQHEVTYTDRSRSPVISDLALDSSSNSYQVFPNAGGLTVMKYDQNLDATPVWTQQFNPPSGYGYSEISEVVSGSTLYILVEETDSTTNVSHVAVLQVGTNGAGASAQASNGSADVAAGFVVIGSKIYVAGTTSSPIVATLFVFTSGGAGNPTEYTYWGNLDGNTYSPLGTDFSGIVTDGTNLYVTGYVTTIDLGTMDIGIACSLSQTGALNWTDYPWYSPPPNPQHTSAYIGQGIAYDGSGHLYVGFYTTVPQYNNNSINPVFELMVANGAIINTYDPLSSTSIFRILADTSGYWMTTSSTSADSELVWGTTVWTALVEQSGYIALGSAGYSYWAVGGTLYLMQAP